MAVKRNSPRRFIAALFASAALGNTQAQPPTPGAVQDTLKAPPVLQAPVSSPALQQEAAALKPQASGTAAGRSITVQGFEFTGNTLLTNEQLAAAVADYVDKPITLVELYEAADRITALYVRQGYTLASAIVPAQKVTEGTVRLEVVEGRISQLKYEGFKRYEPRDLAPILGTPEGQLYQSADFEQRLRTLDTLPGLDVRARLQPGEQYGTSDILLIGEETLLQGTLFADNAGTENIGVIRMGAQLTLNNPLGVADQLSLTGLRSRESLLKYGSATYSLPVGLGASRLALTYGLAEFDVSGAFEGIGGSNRNLRGELSLPLHSSSRQRYGLSLAASHVKANTDFSGVTFNRSKVTLAEVAGNYSRSHSNRAVTQLGLVVASNFSRFDASDATPSAVPLKADLDVQHLLPLALGFQLLGRAQFVYALDALPDTQKFSLGGPSSVRSYAPSEARGDWGYLAQFTLSRSFALGPVLISPHAFYDLGEVRQHDASRFPPGSQPQDVRLAGYGFGSDVNYRTLSMKLDYAIPTTNAPVSDGKEDGRFYGSLSLSF